MNFVKRYRVRKFLVSVIAGAIGILCICQIHRVLNSDLLVLTNTPEHSNVDQSNVDPGLTENLTASFLADEAKTEFLSAEVRTRIFAEHILSMINDGLFDEAKAELLSLAVMYVEAEDDIALANTLSQLGELALLQTDIDTADVYLAEALDLFQQNGDEISAAGVYMQMGRLHLVARQRARRASDAYNSLLLARWKISHGLFYEAEPELRSVVERNLALNRYGAAASAYETLFKGYRKEQDHYQAQLAGLEAIRLHAGSGRLFEARKLLHNMRESGFYESFAPGIENEIEMLNLQFEESVRDIGLARDQRQLYNQLQARGDVVNAWRFRQKAGESLAKASARAQYRRQPDVLVELYKSNRSMEIAENSLRHARAVYQRYGLDQELEKSRQLQAQIY
ncbi:hypothetical protein AB833_27260 [Chromatiales bacterium (ex Bugula neritina AB1)]|nr:hypothetical protein AB833_27260 [Chromatiales bacterium (ex Bugula neritina AB1)]